ncbi:hypothetical protein [Photorhabdus bodei]|uniref:Uncharacterized protein n=1 Tax=Photorhabdus bodei TaxID=2029681 RepID=A0ABX0AJM8_9GAMM|nr:hypothetical protein [Photorhabdus bodei]NDK98877.1 hypothetical protein [Photorhabdus bodei]NDL03221.1 hypothetical protein [Photorhabdus bodei]NDL07335.1 hypothetical protein [Photorhabdus bodei]
MTGVSECSQQRGNLKDDRYISIFYLAYNQASAITTNFFWNISMDVLNIP